MTNQKTVFSGVQPTGNLTIGNYIGALSLWVAEQDKHDNIFCIVDLHALTIPEAITAAGLREKTLDVAALYMACGIDPDRSLIFVQSQVRQHSELAWILNCVTPMGWMNRMTQFKSKSENVETIGVGLYDYPVLMAADILVYNADLVPVGDDQRQHLEIAQDIAQRFGNLFGYQFTRPEMLARKEGARIMGLDDPTAKMSKSSSAKGHAVGILDEPGAIMKAFKSAKTDSGSGVDLSQPLSPGVINLMAIYGAFTGKTRAECEAEFDGAGYGKLKTTVGEAVVEGLTPIRERFHAIRGDEAGLRRILDRSAEAAAARAEATMVEVRKAVGIG